MPPPTRSTNSSSSDDEFVLVIAGVVALSVVAGSAGLFWLRGARWLVQHQLLVAASHHPVLAVPGAAGAGLDASRLCVLAGLLVGLLAWVGSALVRRAASRESVG